MRLFDTHCHLTEEPLASDTMGVIGRARAAGVEDILVPASGRASWVAVTALGGLPGVHTAIGLHPWFAQEGVDEAELEEILARHSCAAIGEIGLDLAVDSPPADVQIRVLETQLAVACDVDLPVLLHCRKAFAELSDILKGYLPGLRGLIHAFSRSPEVAEQFLETGFYIAFGGAVTRPEASRARASAAGVPPDRLLLETDAPSIGLDGIPARDVEPRHVREVAAAVAAVRGTTPESVAEMTTANARRFLRLE